jgi:transcriptional regulator with XRE-family HTH domain
VNTKDSAINQAMAAELRAERAKTIGLTVELLAKRSGVSFGTLRRILNGTVDIAVPDLAALAAVFGVSPQELMKRAVENAGGYEVLPGAVSEDAAHNVTDFPKRPTTAEEFDAYQGDRAAHALDEESEHDEED